MAFSDHSEGEGTNFKKLLWGGYWFADFKSLELVFA